MWQSGYEILAWLLTGTHSEEAPCCRLFHNPNTGNYNTYTGLWWKDAKNYFCVETLAVLGEGLESSWATTA